jgi:hypothetical protein
MLFLPHGGLLKIYRSADVVMFRQFAGWPCLLGGILQTVLKNGPDFPV